MSSITVTMRSAAKALFESITIDGGSAYIISSAKRQLAAARFLKATKTDWERLAGRLMQRWKTPAEVDIEDVVQHLHMSVWRYMTRFDNSRGTGFDEFLIFNANASAKKWIHKKRYAILHGNADGNKSRIPTYLEDYGRSPDGEAAAHLYLPDALKVQPDQETMVDTSRTEDRVMRSLRTVREFHAFTAFRDANGVLATAAEILLEDPMVRREIKIWGEDQARSAIVKTVKTVCERMDVAYVTLEA